MTSARAAAAIEPRLEDRWTSAAEPIRRASTAMGVVAVASLAIHAAVLATTVFGERRALAPSQEISVEVVQEPKAPEGKPAPKIEIAKLEAAKPEAARPSAPPKPEPAKMEPNRPEPLKPQLAKFEPPKQPADDPDVAAKAEKLKVLEHELESLKAEREALDAEKAAASELAIRSAAADAPTDKAFGPLPDSFRAVALPGSGEGGTEAVAYKELVFSQLAKAKGFGKRKGLPGSAGVGFTVDETGALVDVAVTHPSGIPALDDEALAIVRKAAPFPPPPKGAQRTFSANVAFVADQ